MNSITLVKNLLDEKSNAELDKKNIITMEEKLLELELELRAEILPKEREVLGKQLEAMDMLHSQTKRLSVMCFGSVGTKKIDVRIRVTNGTCEVIIKSGSSFGSHDRIEVAQKIDPAQFLGMVKIFVQFGFVMKIGAGNAQLYVTGRYYDFPCLGRSHRIRGTRKDAIKIRHGSEQ